MPSGGTIAVAAVPCATADIAGSNRQVLGRFRARPHLLRNAKEKRRPQYLFANSLYDPIFVILLFCLCYASRYIFRELP